MITAAATLLARIGLTRKTLSVAGQAVSAGLKKHGAAIGTAATVASLMPSGSKKGAKSAAAGAEANTYLARHGAATQA